MRLTVYTDYALRTLMYLALSPDRLVTISEIAEHYRISETHLMKVVHQLGIAGDIDTVRGRHGGIRLAKPAEAVNVGEVVRRAEPDMELVQCFGEHDICTIQPSCVLQGVLRKALVAFLGVLDSYTLADLIEPHRKLSALLDLPEPDLAKNVVADQRSSARPKARRLH